VLLSEKGKDATVVFDDVGHSRDAKRCMQAFKVGTLQAAGRVSQEATAAGAQQVTARAATTSDAAPTSKHNGVDVLSCAMAAGVFLVIVMVTTLS
jgi:hypothetical protein